jgi:hypothetical protein
LWISALAPSIHTAGRSHPRTKSSTPAPAIWRGRSFADCHR